jgi:hypothetical protein
MGMARRCPSLDSGSVRRADIAVTRLARWVYFHVTGKYSPRMPRRRPRRGRPRSKPYRKWIRTQPSVASGLMGCEAAHTGSDGGKAMKASDFTCVPLTPAEHLEYHRIGRDGFERKHGICFAAEVERLNMEWEGS